MIKAKEKAQNQQAGLWLTLLLAMLVLLNYVDRGAVGIAAPKLKDELMLSATAFGIAVSAFSWIYAPAQFAVGWLSDRFCVYRIVGAGLVVWSVATFLTGFANGLVMLVALRLMLGIGEGVAFPSASKIIARHVSARAPRPRQRHRCRRTLLGTGPRNVRRRRNSRLLRLAADLHHLRSVDLAMDRAVAVGVAPAMGEVRQGQRKRCSGRPGDAQPHRVADGHWPFRQHLWLLFPARLAAVVPDQSAGPVDPRNDRDDHDRLRRSGVRSPCLGLAFRPAGDERIGTKAGCARA